MQTLEMVQRVLWRWKISSQANMPADVLLNLLDCVNGSIQELYAIAPAIYREGPISGVLAAPTTVNLGVTMGSNVFTGYTPTLAQVGATVLVGPDPNDNIIDDTSGTFVDAYEGVTGTYTGTIYGDVVPLAANIEAMIDEPVLVGYMPRLYKADVYWGRPWSPAINWTEMINASPNRTVGRPRSYWVEPNIACQNGMPMFFIRVDPMPDQLYQIRAKALFYPTRLALTDLQTNTLIPVNDAWIERLFLPLVIERMSSSDLWKGGDVKIVLAEADRARTAISQLRAQFEKPNNLVRTPRGF